MNGFIRGLILIYVASFALTGCGIKPGDVKPPKGAEESAFPRTYPDIKTDPAPRGKNRLNY